VKCFIDAKKNMFISNFATDTIPLERCDCFSFRDIFCINIDIDIDIDIKYITRLEMKKYYHKYNFDRGRHEIKLFLTFNFIQLIRTKIHSSVQSLKIFLVFCQQI
jgi:hypothetical protein